MRSFAKRIPWPLWPTLLLLAALPFELIRPWLDLGWIQFTNLELLLLLAVAGWAVHVARTGRSALPPAGLLAALGLFLGLALLSALLAPVDRAEALKFCGRLAISAAGLLLGYAAVQAAGSRRPWFLALCLGGLFSGFFGLAELGGLGPQLLAPFKVAPNYVGGELRLSGTFQYATINSMYFELLLPLTIALTATTADPSDFRLSAQVKRVPFLLIAGTCLMTIVQSQTRSGILTAAVLLILLLLLAWRFPVLRALNWLAAAALGLLIVFVLEFSFSSPVNVVRLTSRDTSDWYLADYAAPATITVAAGEAVTVPVTVTNRGTVAWRAGGERPFGLGWRWYDAAGAELDRPRGEWLLTQAIWPGAAQTISVTLTPELPAGTYQIFWSMERQAFLSFHEQGSPPAFSTLIVTAGSIDYPAPVPRPPASTAIIPTGIPRTDLWRAALELFAERPLLGWGPDQFRHIYGPRLNLPAWDERIHSNNLYLELLANQGLLGLLSYLGIAAVAGWYAWRRRAGAGAELILTTVVAVSLLGWFGHGLLDYFLSFTVTGLAFWVLVGLLVGQGARSPVSP